MGADILWLSPCCLAENYTMGDVEDEKGRCMCKCNICQKEFREDELIQEVVDYEEFEENI